MIRLVSFIVVAALAITAAVWLAERPGEVRLSWQGWEVETSVALLAAAVALIAVASALLYRLWRALRRAPAALAARRRQARLMRGYRALTQGMVAVAAGDAEEAQRQAKRADALLGEPPLTMLLSAQAAQLNGDEAAASRYFTAMLERPETAFLGLRGLLMQARRAGDHARALELARAAHKVRPRTPWVLTALFDLHAEAGRWREALAVLEEALRRNAVDRTEGRRRLAVALLACAGEAAAAGDRAAALAYARRAAAGAPGFLPASLRLAALLVSEGKKRAAERLVSQAWARAPHPELARLWCALEDGDDPLRQVRRVETLIASNPEHAESRIALARALLAAKLWGAARTHLEKAADAGRTGRVCRLMAELEEGETGDMAAVRCWLTAASTADPDPAWVCGACGAEAADWAPLCPACRAFGTLDWRTPPRPPAPALGTPAPAAAPALAGEGTAGVDGPGAGGVSSR